MHDQKFYQSCKRDKQYGPLGGHKNFSETRVQNQHSLEAVQDHLFVANPERTNSIWKWKTLYLWRLSALWCWLEEEPGSTHLESWTGNGEVKDFIQKVFGWLVLLQRFLIVFFSLCDICRSWVNVYSRPQGRQGKNLNPHPAYPEERCHLPGSLKGSTTLTWERQGFSRPYAWLYGDSRSLGLRWGTSIKGSCHLATCVCK